MRRIVVAVVFLAACSSSSTSPTPAPTPAPAPAPTPAPPSTVEETTEADDRYYTDAELRQAGIQVAPESALPTRQMFGPDGPTPTISGYDFLCGSAPTSMSCVCRRPLPCEANPEPCVSLDANLAGFREALASQGDVQVTCERAEVGRCGEFRYFYFQGDIHRYEMRFFDPDGRLVAQRNSTDYDEYCNHSAGVRWMGRVPKCDRLEREELICGDADRPLRAPLADILAYTRRGQPGP